jgi:signal transduction histidine kinase
LIDDEARKNLAEALDEVRRVERELDAQDVREDSERLEQITERLGQANQDDSEAASEADS